MKVAVVTPYYREPLEVLERCHRSVLAQTHPSTHFMIADGYAQEAINGWENVQHFSLPVSHRDWGNAPRSMGSISAFNQGFDAVAYLDADNWYAEDHIASLVAICTQFEVSVVFSYRQIVLSTGEYCPFMEEGEETGDHIDTNCYFFTKDAAFWHPYGPCSTRSSPILAIVSCGAL